MEGEEEGVLWRSETMNYIQITVPVGSLHDCIEEIGSVGVCEIADLNSDVPPMQRSFASELAMMAQSRRRIDVIRRECDVGHVYVFDPDEQEVASQVDFHLMNEALALCEKDLTECVKDRDQIAKNLSNHVKTKIIIEKAMELFAGTNQDREEMVELLETGLTTVGAVCGVLPQTLREPFIRVVFRMTHGNCVFRHWDIGNESEEPQQEPLSVLFVIHKGKVSRSKIEKVAQQFNMYVFNVALDEHSRRNQLQQTEEKIRDTLTVLNKTKSAVNTILFDVAEQLGLWDVKVTREMRILHEMNKCSFSSNDKTAVIEGWCPLYAADFVTQSVNRGCARGGMMIEPVIRTAHTRTRYPTWFVRNAFLDSFYAIIEGYGVPRYQEFVPSAIYVISFPLLFGIMFGDVGHGFMLLFFSLLLVMDSDRLFRRENGEILDIVFQGRYVLLLMSVFSIYMGFLYNEFFSLSFDLFGSAYRISKSGEAQCTAESQNGNSCDAYLFGLDPVWKQSTNELAFTNSLKMKLSLVVGILHMAGGIALSAMNHLYFANSIEFWHTFIPRILFLVSVFGYLVVLIFLKWGMNFPSTHCAPSLLTILMNMFLRPGTIEPVDAKCIDRCNDDRPWADCDKECFGCNGYLFPHQETVQIVLVCISAVSVVWMLVMPPLAKRWEVAENLSARRPELMLGDESDDDEETRFDFMEEAVNNAVHSFEFVLGGLSNTASYLRLWALSLAHSQLSVIFWEKLIAEQLKASTSTTWLMVMVGTSIWLFVTIGVLLILETLSAFLHALRLHWVEFQNKFYAGDGRKLTPFDLDTN
eukprot:c8292_g1_i1.p1 GENE.c8292_g1_i1~~c8292_g1_i1.p1  ORF type:complete len:811 (+),score=184.16 c8292_g1_i1:27-2459(+)